MLLAFREHRGSSGTADHLGTEFECLGPLRVALPSLVAGSLAK